MSAEFYNTIEKPSTAEFKDRGSRFLGFAFPIKDIEDFKLYRAQLKKDHPKANHHCFAYRLGTEGVNFRVSDDGEPSGTAGRPILGQIDSHQLTNVLIIVVRYFGGTLLGVPGLINAYKTTAALAIRQTMIIQKPVLVNYRLQFDYMLMNDVMKLVKQFDCVIFKQELQLFCLIDIGVPKSKHEAMLTGLQDIRGLEITEPATR
ncbi:MAG TPA: YigZ family protein [Parafilimonas sp.]|nr:YigZ family protein [Parafilimonas sp.]